MSQGRGQVRLLTRHFLRRFLDNDLIAPVVFLSKGLLLAPGVGAAWRHGHWAAHLSLAYSTTWNYRQADQFHRSTITGGVGMQFTLP